jgi:hypothetical protein
MQFEISSNTNLKYTNNVKISDDLYFKSDIGWTTFTKNSAIVYFKGYQISEYTDEGFIDEIIGDPVPKFNGLFIAVICYTNGKTVVTFDIDRGTHIQYNTSPIFVSTMLNTGCESNNLGGQEYIVIDNNTLSTKSYDLFKNYLNFDPMTEEEVLTSIDTVIRNNFKKMLDKNKDPIIVMITGGVDTLIGFSYLKQYTDNFKILTYEHIDFTDFICKNWASFKKRNSSEGLLHFKGSKLILAGGWGDERLIRDPRICNLNFKLHGSSILEEIENHVGEYQYQIAQTPAYKNAYIEQQNIPSMNKIETFREMYNINVHVRGWGHVEENLYFSPLKDLQITNYMLRLPYEVQKKQLFNGYLSKKLIERNDPDLLQYISKYKNHNCFENVYKMFEKYKEYTVTHTF